MSYTLTQLLLTLVEQKGSDLHISVGSSPRIRVDGTLVPLKTDPLTPEQTKALCFGVMTEYQKSKFEKEKQVDLAFSVKNLARFRTNIYLQKNNVSGVFRVIPQTIPQFDNLGLPMSILDLCSLPRGLVLVTGATGSGKSTTLAAMVNHINETRFDHIVTIEDPIEFVHIHKNCVINQRELGEDVTSFALGLKSVLRQDPDVILVGELRDNETIAAALTASETGHLVFGTVHTNSAVQSINRIVDVFPPHQHDQIKTQLSMSLQAVISQVLIPAIGGGRLLAAEILRVNNPVRALINEGKINQIYSHMQSGQDESQMQTLNQSLLKLVQTGRIKREIALEKSTKPEELDEMLNNPAKSYLRPNYLKNPEKKAR